MTSNPSARRLAAVQAYRAAPAGLSQANEHPEDAGSPTEGIPMPHSNARTVPASQPTCRCGATWTGLTRAHCSATKCHRTFSSPALFDRHRVNGQCADPESIMTAPKDGSTPRRAMYLTEGIWQTVEDPAEPGRTLRLWRERQATA